MPNTLPPSFPPQPAKKLNAQQKQIITAARTLTAPFTLKQLQEAYNETNTTKISLPMFTNMIVENLLGKMDDYFNTEFSLSDLGESVDI